MNCSKFLPTAFIAAILFAVQGGEARAQSVYGYYGTVYAYQSYSNSYLAYTLTGDPNGLIGYLYAYYMNLYGNTAYSMDPNGGAQQKQDYLNAFYYGYYAFYYNQLSYQHTDYPQAYYAYSNAQLASRYFYDAYAGY
jgi:hypothetical protein